MKSLHKIIKAVTNWTSLPEAEIVQNLKQLRRSFSPLKAVLKKQKRSLTSQISHSNRNYDSNKNTMSNTEQKVCLNKDASAILAQEVILSPTSTEYREQPLKIHHSSLIQSQKSQKKKLNKHDNKENQEN